MEALKKLRNSSISTEEKIEAVLAVNYMPIDDPFVEWAMKTLHSEPLNIKLWQWFSSRILNKEKKLKFFTVYVALFSELLGKPEISLVCSEAVESAKLVFEKCELNFEQILGIIDQLYLISAKLNSSAFVDMIWKWIAEALDRVLPSIGNSYSSRRLFEITLEFVHILLSEQMVCKHAKRIHEIISKTLLTSDVCMGFVDVLSTLPDIHLTLGYQKDFFLKFPTYDGQFIYELTVIYLQTRLDMQKSKERALFVKYVIDVLDKTKPTHLNVMEKIIRLGQKHHVFTIVKDDIRIQQFAFLGSLAKTLLEQKRDNTFSASLGVISSIIEVDPSIIDNLRNDVLVTCLGVNVSESQKILSLLCTFNGSCGKLLEYLLSLVEIMGKNEINYESFKEIPFFSLKFVQALEIQLQLLSSTQIAKLCLELEEPADPEAIRTSKKSRCHQKMIINSKNIKEAIRAVIITMKGSTIPVDIAKFNAFAFVSEDLNTFSIVQTLINWRNEKISVIKKDDILKLFENIRHCCAIIAWEQLVKSLGFICYSINQLDEFSSNEAKLALTRVMATGLTLNPISVLIMRVCRNLKFFTVLNYDDFGSSLFKEYLCISAGASQEEFADIIEEVDTKKLRKIFSKDFLKKSSEIEVVLKILSGVPSFSQLAKVEICKLLLILLMSTKEKHENLQIIICKTLLKIVKDVELPHRFRVKCIERCLKKWSPSSDTVGVKFLPIFQRLAKSTKLNRDALKLENNSNWAEIYSFALMTFQSHECSPPDLEARLYSISKNSDCSMSMFYCAYFVAKLVCKNNSLFSLQNLNEKQNSRFNAAIMLAATENISDYRALLIDTVSRLGPDKYLKEALIYKYLNCTDSQHWKILGTFLDDLKDCDRSKQIATLQVILRILNTSVCESKDDSIEFCKSLVDHQDIIDFNDYEILNLYCQILATSVCGKTCRVPQLYISRILVFISAIKKSVPSQDLFSSADATSSAYDLICRTMGAMLRQDNVEDILPLFVLVIEQLMQGFRQADLSAVDHAAVRYAGECLQRCMNLLTLPRFRKITKKHAHCILLSFAYIEKSKNRIHPASKNPISNGLFSLMDILGEMEMQFLSNSMDSDAKSVYHVLYGRYLREHKQK